MNFIYSVRCHQLSFNEKYILSGNNQGKIGVSNTNFRKRVYLKSFQKGDITCIRTTKGYFFLGCFSDHILVLKNKFSFSQVQAVKLKTHVFNMAINDKNTRLLVGGFVAKHVEIFEINKKEETILNKEN